MAQEDHLEAALQSTAGAVEKKLDKLMQPLDGAEGRLVEAMRYSMFAGGKRLRPFLVVASSDLFQVGKECSLRVAAAIECVHGSPGRGV